MSENPANETNVNREGVKHKRKWIITAIVIFGIVMLVGLFFLFKSDPIKDFTNAMSINDFTAAATIYNEKMSEQNQNEVTPIIVEQIKQIEKDFEVKSTNFDEANTRFKNLELIVKDSVPELIQTRNRVQALNTSRVTFERGVNEVNAGNYESAIDILSKITVNDESYQKAIEAIEQATSLYREQTIKTITSMTDDALFDDALKAIDMALVTFPDDIELLEQREKAINLREEQRIEEYNAKVAQLEAEQIEKERQEQEAKAAEKRIEDERKAQWREENKEKLERLKSEQPIFVGGLTKGEDEYTYVWVDPNINLNITRYGVDEIAVLFYDSQGNPLPGSDHLKTYRGALKLKIDPTDKSGRMQILGAPDYGIARGCAVRGFYYTSSNVHAEAIEWNNEYYSFWLEQYEGVNFYSNNE